MATMGVFRFKRFSVQNERSSMKVNTDGVLLGAAMTLRPSDRLLLDIGTGTGTITLMAAQRLAEISENFNITGIDIDYDSTMEAKENFLSSPWSDKLVAEHISLNDFEKECTTFRYNHIFSNPPYFESSLKSPDERKRAARHAETMSYREIIAFASRHLTREAGRLSMILPYETEREAVRHAASFDLRLFRHLRIRTTPTRPFSRVILEFTLASPNEVISEELTIQDNSGYTDSYHSLVRDFLLI